MKFCRPGMPAHQYQCVFKSLTKLSGMLVFTNIGILRLERQSTPKSLDSKDCLLADCESLTSELNVPDLMPDLDNALLNPRPADGIIYAIHARWTSDPHGSGVWPARVNNFSKRTSKLKHYCLVGGDLARISYPARVVVLITSDVSAVPMSQLSGGPCAYDPKDETALGIVAKYRLLERVPLSVRDLLEETIPWVMAADKQLDENKKFKFVYEYVIACNADAMECMSVEVSKLGLFPIKLNSTCFGALREFAKEYVKMTSLMILAVEGKIDRLDMYEQMKDSPICPLTDAKVQEIFPRKDKWGLGICLLLGGRPTMSLCPEPGKGGPNQELALYFSLYWYFRTEQYPILREYTVWFLGGSSYGKDGNTVATGAFSYKSLGTDIYPNYEEAHSKFANAYSTWWQLQEESCKDYRIVVNFQVDTLYTFGN